MPRPFQRKTGRILMDPTGFPSQNIYFSNNLSRKPEELTAIRLLVQAYGTLAEWIERIILDTEFDRIEDARLKIGRREDDRLIVDLW